MKAAYLNGDLKEEIYMNQAEGLVELGNDNKIDTYLESIGLTRTHADNCVYHKRSDDKILIITVYVDDLLIFASHVSEIDQIKAKLNN